MPKPTRTVSPAYERQYTVDAPCRYRLDIPTSNHREVLKTAIGTVLFTISVMAFALGLYLT